MVSIPVRLYKAARRERIKFHRVYHRPGTPEPEVAETEETEAPVVISPTRAETPKPFNPVSPAAAAAKQIPVESIARVRNAPVEEDRETQVEASEVLKGYEIEKDRYVTFRPEEVAAVRAKTSTELDIAEFVRLSEIDPIFFETSYYAAADRGGEKPYALLFWALSETGYAAIGSLAMHGREHATVIRPGRRGLILHTLFFNNEVRQEEEYASDGALVNPKELDLAKRFVQALAAPFEAAKLKDAFEERLRTLIEERAETAVALYGEGVETPKQTPVIDIMEALKKSLEMARRGPVSETNAPGTRTAKGRRKRRAG